MELYVTIPDHTVSAEERENGAVREEFVFGAVDTTIWQIADYLASMEFVSMYGDFVSIRIVRINDDA